ncbi:transcription factor bHLH162-like [Magnolia sinica]|uniref:transcription factor bHLH162-like n=1 Tax=Magnolia sinica TaxID=86752 RepID=UPI002659F904|nr:transcription factor bHLH162-like [Magnolia sinica]
MKSCNVSSKLERKTVERNRRMHMKSLCFKLASLIPPHYSKEALSQQDQLDQAAVYIKQLREKIDELKEKRDLATSIEGINKDISGAMMVLGLRLPVVEVRDLGSSLEVVLISGLNKNFMLCDVISVIEEEGAEVVNASFSFVADKVFHIIHSQVTSSRVGFESSRVYERLRELVR